jgi:hypothetical protein
VAVVVLDGDAQDVPEKVIVNFQPPTPNIQMEALGFLASSASNRREVPPRSRWHCLLFRRLTAENLMQTSRVSGVQDGW